MIFKRRIFFYSIVPLLLFCETTTPTLARTRDSFLRNALKLTRSLLHKCWSQALHLQKEDVLVNMWACLKCRSLLALDRMAESNRIQFTDDVSLVKYRNHSSTNSTSFGDFSSKFGRNDHDWESQAIEKTLAILNTHVLKINLDSFNSKVEGRRRHHHMSLVVFGVLALALIAIPMGFLFLAVLGGKALLLAKLALILTSIQGLKKIATSSLNYGLYQSPQGHYDRRWYYDVKDDQQGYQGYNVPDATLDLLHPLSPRILSAQDVNR